MSKSLYSFGSLIRMYIYSTPLSLYYYYTMLFGVYQEGVPCGVGYVGWSSLGRIVLSYYCWVFGYHILDIYVGLVFGMCILWC